jgi:uncharacterized protein YggU (UPF0235/DUF167 family)
VAWQGEWKLYLKAPAIEGRANAACVEFFARSLRIPKSSVRLLAGEKSRRKVIAVEGVALSDIQALAEPDGHP